ncbi:MAG: DUF1501 domain-containing protein [Lentisphaeraceae bacterium]|nr:DUF1501 domain-containing protein [Lentisphaeraceae bacterium]
MDRRKFLQFASATAGCMSFPSFANENIGPGKPHFTPKAKRIIYLYQSGGPSQLELFDHKPVLNKMHGQELPDSVRQGQRLTGMSGNQSSLPLTRSIYKFKQHGQAGTWCSELLPHTSKIVDDICVIKTMYTEAINHGPGSTFMQTGSQIAGRPSIGAWLQFGLGSDNKNLPPFVVMRTKGSGGQPLFARLWGNGFLPSEYQGVQFRAEKDPVLYLTNPAGISNTSRRKALDGLAKLQAHRAGLENDPNILSRMSQYDMAYRMQSSIPEAVDTSKEPEHIFELYGKDSKKPGTYAHNCLLARRMAERGVKFIQLYHTGWDHHGGLPGGIKKKCAETDQASAALISDLKQRGLLEDTLVIWGGEFGRTSYCQGKLTKGNYGRDHHPKCASMWMAGGGIKGGMTFGETDDFSYNILPGSPKMHVHDFHATILHQLGIDHEKLTYKFQGRRYRLTDVHGHVIKDILS